MNSQCKGAIDLGANLTLNLGRLRCPGDDGILARKSTGGVEQTRHLVLRFHAAPAIRLPFARERQMYPEICIGMRLRVGGNLGDPRCWDHDARGRDNTFVERVKACCVFRVGDAEIIGVKDQELGVSWMAESLGYGLRLSGKRRREKEQCR